MSRSRNRNNRKEKAIETDSRTATFARKRLLPSSAASSQAQAPPNKRRKRSARNSVREDNSSAVGATTLRDFVPFSSLQDTRFATGSMPVQNLGQNRLRSGFFNPGRIERSASHAGTPSDSDDSDIIAQDPVVHEVDSEDDGGITLNLQKNDGNPIVISDDENPISDSNGEGNRPNSEEDSLEEGEEREIVVNNTSSSQVQNIAGQSPHEEQQQVKRQKQEHEQDEDVPFVIDTTPSMPQTLLKDLTPRQLEIQLKYAFWQLKRDAIDLSRPARCLQCQSEGHIDEDCPQKICSNCGLFGEHASALCPKVRRCGVCREPGHERCEGMRNTTIPCDLCSLPGHIEVACPLRHYPRATITGSEPLRLWISCCSCASKSHLVGDCAQVTSSASVRWSLKALDPDQVVNLSLQKGIEKLEKDAQNRNMRPEGLKIRGRAAHHFTDGKRQNTSDSDDLDDFLQHPPRSRDAKRRPPPKQSPRQSDQYRPRDDDDSSYHDRYDRFAAPNGLDSYRPPRNSFYATDSFGRPRSRSPPRRDFQPRGRSPSPSGSYYRPPPPGRGPSPPRHRNPTTMGSHSVTKPSAGSGISISLPTRKGSNPNFHAGSPPGAKLPPKPPTATNAPTARKPRHKKNQK